MMKLFSYPPLKTTVSTSGLATEAKQDDIIDELQDVNSELNDIQTDTSSIDSKLTTTNSHLNNIKTDTGSIDSKLTTSNSHLNNIETDTGSIDTKLTTTNTHLNNIKSDTASIDSKLLNIEFNTNINYQKDVVDLMDTPFLDTSVTNIPASSSSPLEIVASLANRTNEIMIVEDIGEFIGLYTGAPSSEQLLTVLPLGGGKISINIPQGTRISLRNMKNTAITSGFISITFFGV